MSFDNILMFTGKFLDKPGNNLYGKNLYIPATDKHPAFTFKIIRVSLFGITNIHSFGIQFNSAEDRQLVADYDFAGEIFYIDVKQAADSPN